MDAEDVPVLIAGGSLVGLSTALFLGLHGVPLARRRAPSRHGDPSARGARQPADDRAVPRRRARGRDHRGLGPGVRPERGDRVGRVARRPRDRLVLPEHQRGRRGPEPVGAALRHADRARADPAEAGRGARRPARVRHGARLVRGRRRRRDRGRQGSRRRSRAHGPRPLPRRGRRQPQPGAAAARHPARRATGRSRTASRSTSAPTSGRCSAIAT